MVGKPGTTLQRHDAWKWSNSPAVLSLWYTNPRLASIVQKSQVSEPMGTRAKRSPDFLSRRALEMTVSFARRATWFLTSYPTARSAESSADSLGNASATNEDSSPVQSAISVPPPTSSPVTVK